MAAARTNTPAAVRERSVAAKGKKPSNANVMKTVAKNTAHTNELVAAKPAGQAVSDRAVAAGKPKPNAAQVAKTLSNNAIRSSAVAKARANSNSAVAESAGRSEGGSYGSKPPTRSRPEPELTRSAVIARAKAVGKRPKTPQVTKTLAASRGRATRRSAMKAKTRAF